MVPDSEVAVEAWQVVLLVFLVLLPFALMADFFPQRERFNARGRPLDRAWEPQLRHPERNGEDAH